MPLDFARRLMGRDRTARANRQLGVLLAFVAGATNAGAFLAVKQYTSHMTGIVSSLADHLVLGDFRVALSAGGGLLFFLSGAAVAAVLVNYARRHRLHSEYALPLLVEASLLLVFGLMGAWLSSLPGLFVPATVMLLCFAMGLQNALISKASNTEIRSTHVTGLVTDIGIEIGKSLYWNRVHTEDALRVGANRERLAILSSLALAFFVGGLAGAVGFNHFGYATTVLLAVLLAVPACVPALDDLQGRLSSRNAA